MAAPNILDTASDYGSDFSPEDELLLIELSSNTFKRLPVPVATAPCAGSGGTASVDLLPGRTDPIEHEDVAVSGDISVSNALSLAAVPDVATSGSLDQDVTYPDCAL